MGAKKSMKPEQKGPYFVKSRYLRTIPLEEPGKTIVYHTLFGNPASVTQNILDLVSHFEVPRTAKEAETKFGVPKDIIKDLQDVHFIVTEGSDERENLKQELERRTVLAPSGALVDTLRFMSADCNFSCSYCSIIKASEAGPQRFNVPGQRFPWDTAKTAVDKFLGLVRRHGHSKVNIRFFGGEPLLDWDVYRRVIEYASAQVGGPEISFSINTNGSLITPKIAQFLSDHEVKTVVSIDGVQEVNDKFRVNHSGKGTFGLIKRGLDRLKKAGVKPHIAVALNRANIGRLRETIDFAKSIGGESVALEGLDFTTQPSEGFFDCRDAEMGALKDARRYGKSVNFTISSERWNTLGIVANHKSMNYCVANGVEITVDYRGTVFPCFSLPVKIGDITDLEGIFKHPMYQEMSLRIVGNIPGCEGCEIEGLCRGCCASDLFVRKGNVQTLDEAKCETRRAMTRELLKEAVFAQVSPSQKT